MQASNISRTLFHVCVPLRLLDVSPEQLPKPNRLETQIAHAGLRIPGWWRRAPCIRAVACYKCAYCRNDRGVETLRAGYLRTESPISHQLSNQECSPPHPEFGYD